MSLKSELAALQMFDPELFEAEVSEHFGFLLNDFGFQREPLKVVGAECWLSFTKRSVKVIVSQEAGAPCFVTLHDTEAEGSGNRVEFGLHELQQEATRGGGARPAVRANTNLHQEISALAENLQAIGQEVLLGDFIVLRERHARHKAAVRRNSSSGQAPGG